MSEFDIHEWVAASRSRQGLPEYVEDDTILARVARVVSEAPGNVHRGPLSSSTSSTTETTSKRILPPPLI